MPTVLNRHHFDGRPFPKPWKYIGRGTPLGNPFHVRDHGPERALALYKAWLWKKLRERDVQVTLTMKLITAEHHLVCSCAPKPCHGDVVVAAWEWMHGEEGARELLELGTKADGTFGVVGGLLVEGMRSGSGERSSAASRDRDERMETDERRALLRQQVEDLKKGGAE